MPTLILYSCLVMSTIVVRIMLPLILCSCLVMSVRIMPLLRIPMPNLNPIFMFSDEYYSGADYANLNPIFMFSDEYYSGADYATPEDSYAQPYSNGTEGFR